MKDYLGRKFKIFDLVWDIKNECFAIVVGNNEIYTNEPSKVYSVESVLLLNLFNKDVELNKQKEILYNQYKLYTNMQLKLNNVKSPIGSLYTSENISGNLYLYLGKTNLYKDGLLFKTGYTYIPMNLNYKKRVDDLKTGVLINLFPFSNIYPHKEDISILKHKKANIAFSSLMDISPVFGDSGKYSWVCVTGRDYTQVNFTLELLEYKKKE